MRLCCIGDSFVNGTGDDGCLGWAGRIVAAARRQGRDVTLYNLGVRGDTSADIGARWEREARARLGKIDDGSLIFSFGVNDCLDVEGRARLAPERSLAAAGEILTRAQAWLPTLMIGPPPVADPAVNEHIRSLSGRFEILCRKIGVPFLAVFADLLASPVWMREVTTRDDAHPNSASYEQFAHLIQRWPPWLGWIADPEDLRNIYNKTIF